MAGYHKTPPRTVGKYPEFSQIVEEFEELLDAHAQGCQILELVELSDLYGAIEGYIHKAYGFAMEDLAQMSDLTKHAFEDGIRD